MILPQENTAKSIISWHLFIASAKNLLLLVLKTKHQELVVKLMKGFLDSGKDVTSHNIS